MRGVSVLLHMCTRVPVVVCLREGGVCLYTCVHVVVCPCEGCVLVHMCAHVHVVCAPVRACALSHAAVTEAPSVETTLPEK